ncbi:MAG: hypothetical protein ACLP9L_22850 [Thermoguttaceae bacterium]
MPKLNTTRRDLLQNHQSKTIDNMLNDSEQSFDATLDFSICEGRKRPMQAFETHQERIPLADVVRDSEAQPPIEDFFPSNPTHDTKRSREAVDVATQLSMERHGWKQTGEKSPLWVFEHRSPHRRDHAEGRNHRLQGK